MQVGVVGLCLFELRRLGKVGNLGLVGTTGMYASRAMRVHMPTAQYAHVGSCLELAQGRSSERSAIIWSETFATATMAWMLL
jgi:hypothetical protein